MANRNEQTDVVIIGSGATGLTAAISACASAARVLVLESSASLGGTSAMSGGVIWVPGNPAMAKRGWSDSREAALTYLESMSLGKTDRGMLETFVDTGPEMISFLERETPLRFSALTRPDYHSHFPGGTFGRSVLADLVPGSSLGKLRSKLRSSPHFPVPFTLLDLEGPNAKGRSHEDLGAVLSSPEMGERLQNDMLGSGLALIGGLLAAAVGKGADIRVGARVSRLVKEAGAVIGVEYQDGQGSVRVEARKGVILASGGFEQNAELAREFLRGPMTGSPGSPSNQGDGLLMAMEAGAALGNMSEAWWMPVANIPGEEYEGKPFYRLVTVERNMPGSIIVNKYGRRFMNEAQNYNDIGRAFHTFNPFTFDYENLPAWLIIDSRRFEKYAFLTHFPGDPEPNWLAKGSTLRELALKVGVDPHGLDQTVERFNVNARQGIDPDFHRGSVEYDQYLGDQSFDGALRSLGPLDVAPFYALQIHSGALATKGGAKINENAQVLSARGGPIAGLFAAGNASAGITGMSYPGAGGTLGPAMTFGYIAGRRAAGNAG